MQSPSQSNIIIRLMYIKIKCIIYENGHQYLVHMWMYMHQNLMYNIITARETELSNPKAYRRREDDENAKHKRVAC